MSCIAAIIDGTLKKNARPSRNQHILFNGWKQMHCLKYHLLVSPDGIIIHIFGPVEGHRHDITMLRESGLEDILAAHFWGPNRKLQYFVYGDAGYTTAGHIIAPYKRAQLTDQQRAFNEAMSKIRKPVEWMFKEVNSMFEFLNPADNQKILLSPIGQFYLVAILLTNTHTILHHPQTPKYFNCVPPTLAEYFHGEEIADEELDAWGKEAPWEEIDGAR